MHTFLSYLHSTTTIYFLARGKAATGQITLYPSTYIVPSNDSTYSPLPWTHTYTHTQSHNNIRNGEERARSQVES